MTVRTVEQEATVTETEDVALCDSCGQSADAGELHEVTDLPGEPRHYHRACVPTLDGGVPVSDTEQTVNDAASAIDYFGDNYVVVRKMDYLVLLLVPVASLPAAVFASSISMVGMLVCQLCVLLLVYVGAKRRAAATAEELFEQQD